MPNPFLSKDELLRRELFIRYLPENSGWGGFPIRQTYGIPDLPPKMGAGFRGLETEFEQTRGMLPPSRSADQPRTNTRSPRVPSKRDSDSRKQETMTDADFSPRSPFRPSFGVSGGREPQTRPQQRFADQPGTNPRLPHIPFSQRETETGFVGQRQPGLGFGNVSRAGEPPSAASDQNQVGSPVFNLITDYPPSMQAQILRRTLSQFELSRGQPPESQIASNLVDAATLIKRKFADTGLPEPIADVLGVMRSLGLNV